MYKVDNNISVGDVVYSKQHNRKVTVHEINKDSVICLWFDNDYKLHEELISFSQIKLI